MCKHYEINPGGGQTNMPTDYIMELLQGEQVTTCTNPSVQSLPRKGPDYSYVTKIVNSEWGQIETPEINTERDRLTSAKSGKF